MNIGLISHSGFGGSVRTVCRLAIALAEGGHTVHLVARASPPWWPSEPRSGLHHHPLGPISGSSFTGDLAVLAMAAKLAELALEIPLDLLHVHHAVPHVVTASLVAAMVRPQRHLPILVTLHGTDVTVLGQQPELKSVLRHALATCDGVTAVSRALAQEAETTFNLSAIRVIPGFVDVTKFRRQLLARECRLRLASDEESLLVHLSNFRPVKRSVDSVSIMARVSSQLPCRLLLLGDGPEHQTCLQLAEQLGVADRVIAPGALTDVVELLSLADVLLMTSASEAFGLAALEAMSCNVPVVASRVGGLPELLGDDAAGLLCPPGDISAMAEATLAVLQNPHLARRLGSCGRARAERHFAEQVVVEHYLNTYRELLSQ